MKKQLINWSGLPVMMLGLCVVLLGIGGWFANLVKLIGMLEGEVTAMFIARIVGAFAAPIGAVLGYF